MARRLAKWFLIAGCIARPAPGADFADGRLTINGAGGAAYAVTGHNELQSASLEADPSGTFRNVELNLTILGKISPQFVIASQLFFDNFGQASSGTDWTFAEIRFANQARLRLGKVKLPFGLSNEVEGIGTLRPFYSLPDAVYGPTSISSDAYYGAGLTGELLARDGWTLNYDLFGGQTTVATVEPYLRLTGRLVPGTLTVSDEDDVTSLIGGRLVIGTPIEGLSLQASAYRGTHDATLLVTMLSLEYQDGHWLLRAEAFRGSDTSINHGGYVELARFLTKEVQIAAQVQGMRTHAHGVPDGSPLLVHTSAALGLNYWFSSGLVFKASVMGIRGNRLAFPRLLDDALLSGTLERDTSLFTAGTQFSF